MLLLITDDGPRLLKIIARPTTHTYIVVDHNTLYSVRALMGIICPNQITRAFVAPYTITARNA